MADETASANSAVATEVKPETTTVGKKKVEKTGNLIMDIAQEVESMSKTQALNRAEKLANSIETDYFMLGGILKLISTNSWFEGAPDFAAFVREKFGFEVRKAHYLISIYDNLVTKQIPWEKVHALGWTKLKDLAPHLTPENVDEWVLKATPLTVLELQKLISESTPNGNGDKTIKTSDSWVKIVFKLAPDQADVVQQGLAKAKGELQTESDGVALENVMAGYVGGNTTVAAGKWTLDDVIKQTGFQPLLERVAELFPMFDITVTKLGGEGVEQGQQVATQ